MFDRDLLLSVSKPGRYIDGEIGAARKDLSLARVSVCLCFPDTYEIGMSHLGLRILYDVINKTEGYAADRVFSPWVDMQDKMKADGRLLTALESRRPVKEFDVLGISLQYELSYTNVLGILSLSGIPLKAKDRGCHDPLVIAGGPCCLNPEPMAEFIDAFVVGEAEEVILEILETVEAFKKNPHRRREELLSSLGSLKGVYVPSLHQGGAAPKVSKRIVMDLEKILDLKRWVVPYIEIVHDRIGIEIMRGCPHACRFCQARVSFYPLRVLKAETVLEAARRLYRQTGYDEISLLSLSSSDHPRLEHIVRCLAEEFRDKGVSISLPSVRAKDLVGDVSKIFATMRKTSLTFAPEAGSERLRRVIGKEIDVAELFEVARRAYAAGYRLLKLYFMIGLPTETEEDLEAIVDMSWRLTQLKRDVDGRPARLNLSISNFIPKPHTPFQWQKMATREELREKQDFLRNLFRKCKGLVHPTFHDMQASFLEGVLSRGDRRLGALIQSAFENGARFDAWQNLFNMKPWQEAFARHAIDPKEYLEARDPAKPLPWSFIDIGFSPEILRRESERALS